MTQQTSKGHVAFIGAYEYFTSPDGTLLGAPTHNYIGVDGYRSGARFESTAANADNSLASLRSIYGEPSNEVTFTLTSRYTYEAQVSKGGATFTAVLTKLTFSRYEVRLINGQFEYVGGLSDILSGNLDTVSAKAGQLLLAQGYIPAERG
jgi:hypothetical protein